MRCFNHRDADAVGTCKVCQKGLCDACAADLEHGIACKGKHEAEASLIHSLVLRNMKVQGTAGRARYVAPAFYAFMGAVFFIFGIRDTTPAASLPLYMGAGFLIFAVIVFVANRRAYSGPARDAG